ncbi:MAG TPA: hypothetical protein VG889_21365 [Rhizomicrobium sp.]|nr:hypothetical protein [Rhizomicrobium sp.]
MGVTIHYAGRLKDEAAYDAAIAIARDFAQAQGWSCADIPEEVRHLERMSEEEEWTYDGPTRGVELHPHPQCEPVRLEFDRELYLQNYTKTQFAPIEVHIAVTGLLHALAPCFAALAVNDEAEYFDTGNRERLAQSIEWGNSTLRALTGPDAKVGVKLPSGRILDAGG